MIEEANDTALTAEATIEAAETDALMAREIANEAEANATQASEVSWNLYNIEDGFSNFEIA